MKSSFVGIAILLFALNTSADESDSTTSNEAEEAILDSLGAIALDELKGDEAERISDPFFNTDGRVSPGGELSQSLHRNLSPFIGSALYFSTLEEIRGAIVRSFDEAGTGLVRAAIPEQDITSGTLRIVFTRGRVGSLTVNGAKYFDQRRYTSFVRDQEGDGVDTDRLLSDIDWLTRNPYRWVSAVYRSGDDFGDVDIELLIREQRPWTVSLGYDREGTDLLGEDRWSAAFVHGNVFGIDHRVAYQYITDVEFDSLQGHFASYLIPLPWRHELRLSGYYAESDTTIDLGAAGIFELGGMSWQTSAEYIVPLPRLGKLKSDVTFGFDFASSDSNLVFGSLSASDTATEIVQFRAGLDARLPDALGVTAFRVKGVWSPGDLTPHNTDEVFGESRVFARADYFYLGGNIDRNWDLPWGMNLRTDVSFQASSSNLLASEQLILSGEQAVRGFERSLLRGDHGVVTKAQLNGPKIDRSVGAVDYELTPFGFWDNAWGWSVDQLPGEPENIQLGSVGVGLHAKITKHLNASVSYGWQVSESGFEDDESGRLHIGVTSRW